MSGFAGLASCVHCGFCLQACPTYVATSDEADGPRGRIILMQRLAAGDLTADDRHLQHHLDRCLGCRACEPVCPAGVTYGGALEAARVHIRHVRPLPLPSRLVLQLVANPALRRIGFAVARLIRPLAGRFAGWHPLGFAAGMLAGSAPPSLDGRPADRDLRPGVQPTKGRGEVAVFRGCVQHELFGHVNAAASRTLGANGYTLREVAGQGCCGALHAHAGDLEGARALARENVRAFGAAPEAAVAATAAGCGAMLREYETLLADDPLADAARALAARVRDVTELLAAAGPAAGAPLAVDVAYDAPCHLVHAQRVTEAPLTVLRAVPALRITPHEERDACCGSAGIYGLAQRRLARAVLERKLEAIAAADPDAVATGNPGCAMQLAAGLRAVGHPLPVVHPVELLDASYARAGWYRTGAIDSGLR